MAILDTNKEGFLRSTTSVDSDHWPRSCINVSGEVHMYADKITDSVSDHRRSIVAVKVGVQRERWIVRSLTLASRTSPIQLAREDEDTRTLLAQRAAASDHTAPVKGGKEEGASDDQREAASRRSQALARPVFGLLRRICGPLTLNGKP